MSGFKVILAIQCVLNQQITNLRASRCIRYHNIVNLQEIAENHQLNVNQYNNCIMFHSDALNNIQLYIMTRRNNIKRVTELICRLLLKLEK